MGGDEIGTFYFLGLVWSISMSGLNRAFFSLSPSQTWKKESVPGVFCRLDKAADGPQGSARSRNAPLSCPGPRNVELQDLKWPGVDRHL